MRFLDKFISFIFSLVIIVVATVVLLVMTNLIEYSVVENILKEYVFNVDYSNTIILSAILVILAGLKVTVFSSSLKSKARKSLIVDTPHGKIQIAQDTIEGVAKNVIKDYSEIKDVQARMTKARKGINMYMVLLVYQNINIKEVVTNVQNDVKKQIEDTTSIKVRNVDVKIKNIVSVTANKPAEKNNVIKQPETVIENKKEENTIVKVEENKKEEENLIDESNVVLDTENESSENV